MDEACFVDEHPVGSYVLIEVEVNGRKQKLESATLESTWKSKSKCVLLPIPMHINEITGKKERVRIGGERIHLTISNDEKHHAYNYYSTKFGYVKIEDEDYLAVFTNDPAMPSNRRGAYRLSITAKAEIKDDMGREFDTCHLRDISVTGISFIIEPPKEKEPEKNRDRKRDANKDMKIGINHYLTICFTYNNLLYRVTAQVVRVIKNDNGVVIIGAKFKEPYQNINELCAFLMREELRINNKYNR